MLVPAVSLKLSIGEVVSIREQLHYAVKLLYRDQRVTIEAVVLAEHYFIWSRKALLFSMDQQAPIKMKNFKMPLSVARILHSRFQRLPATFENQSVLYKLDSALTNRGMKP